ncbi:MAG: DUF5668 domain-containing protein [Vicinamibacterales bacterium]
MMTNATRTSIRRDDLIIGLMLTTIGLVLLLQRTGTVHFEHPWSLWPFILLGSGAARMAQSLPDGPVKGVLLLTTGAWLLMIQAGWMSLYTSWPLLVVALGLALVLGSISRRATDPGGPPSGHQSPVQSRLSVVGIWVTVIIAAQSPGFGSSVGPSDDSTTHVWSVMGRPGNTAPAGMFQGGDMITVMGRSELNLTRATVESGETVRMQVVSMMGRTVVRVPEHWSVDVATVRLASKVVDERKPRPVTAGDQGALAVSPRLELHGVVAMGTLVIRN